MVLHDSEAEKFFIAPFDCRFPYDDPSASALIRQGWLISLNAAFCVLHELCRPPKHGAVVKDRLRTLVGEWAAVGPDHPIKEPVLQAAYALIDDTPLPWREGVELMQRVSDYDAQRAALAIAYFASDCDSSEGDKALTRADADIRQRWDAKGV